MRTPFFFGVFFLRVPSPPPCVASLRWSAPLRVGLRPPSPSVVWGHLPLFLAFTLVVRVSPVPCPASPCRLPHDLRAASFLLPSPPALFWSLHCAVFLLQFFAALFPPPVVRLCLWLCCGAPAIFNTVLTVLCTNFTQSIALFPGSFLLSTAVCVI